MKTLFKCEICGKIYEDETEAKRCEKDHEMPLEVTPMAYGEGTKYPYKVKVKFGNVTAIYRYEDGLWGV